MENEDSIFQKSRDVFLDTVSTKSYVHLDRVSMIYKSLQDSIKKPLKMILLYGKPGTGKSMFLNKLYEDELSQDNTIYLYKTPILDEQEFYKRLAQDIYNEKNCSELNFTEFMQIIEKKQADVIPVILLDEAQLYSEVLMEKIRLLSDTRAIKFVIALHKTEKEDLIAKEHFQTRIWESIELENASKSELKIYIQKKLMKENCFESANMFTTKAVNKIYKITKGNYRDTNKLLYTLFEIYSIYNEDPANTLKRVNTNTISNKIIEMSAIHSGLLND